MGKYTSNDRTANSIKDGIHSSTFNKYRKTPHGLNGPNRWIEDGVDHINISFFGVTKLGQMLEFSNRGFFKHDIFGNFFSLSAFWAYMRSNERPDSLHKVSSIRAINEIQRATTTCHIDHFKAILMDAAYQRVISHQELFASLIDSTLPFDSYKVDPETFARTSTANGEWVSKGYEEIRSAIMNDRLPNFDFLTDFPTDDIYESVRPKVSAHLLQRMEEIKSQKVRRNEPKPVKVYKEVEKKEEVKEKRPLHFTHKSGIPLVITDEAYLDAAFPSKTLEFNGVTLKTGFSKADVVIPLMDASYNEGLAAQGLMSVYDVVRSAPITKVLFNQDHVTPKLFSAQWFGLRSPSNPEHTTRIPVDLTIIDSPKAREMGIVEEPESESFLLTFKQDRVIRYLEHVYQGSDPVKEQLGDVDEKWKYVTVRIEGRVHLDRRFNKLSLSGIAVFKDLRTGPHFDKTAEVLPLTPVEYQIAAYTPMLSRGKLFKEATAEDTSEYISVDKLDDQEPTGTFEDRVIGAPEINE